MKADEKIARKLCKAGGYDPDALAFNAVLEKTELENVFLVPDPKLQVPLWQFYSKYAHTVIDMTGKKIA